MNDQPKPTTWVPAHMDKNDEGFYAPKPTDEWTAATVRDIAGRQLRASTGDDLVAAAHNAQIAAEADQWRKALTAAADLAKQTFAEKDKQLAAEREKSKAWEEDAARYASNSEHWKRRFDKKEQELDAERESRKDYQGEAYRLNAELGAERERADKFERLLLLNTVPGTVEQLRQQLAAERQKVAMNEGIEEELREANQRYYDCQVQLAAELGGKK